MNNERYNQIIDEVYENYKTEVIRQRESQKKHVEKLRSQGKRLKVTRIELLSKEEFINKCKTDSDFSEKWGLTIEERELSLEERSVIAKSNHYEVSQNIKMFVRVDEDHTLHKHLDDINIPTKLITLTYNNETVESYE